MFVVPLLVGHPDGEDGVGARVGVGATEQVELPDRLGLLGAQHGVHRVGVDQEQPLARVVQRVEGAGLDQRLGDLLVAGRDVDLVEVVGEVGVFALAGPGGDQRAHHVGADVADGAEAEAYVGTDRGEVQLRFVDVRRQHRDAELAAVRQIHRGLVLVVTHRREQAGHVLTGIVGLEVGRPVRHQPVPRRVRLVERVVGERKDGVPQRLHRAGREAVGPHSLGEALELLLEHLTLLLAHRLSENVGSGERIAGDLLGDAHDLLLVDDQAVGLGQDVLEGLGEFGVDGLDRLPAVLAVGIVVVGVHAHRAGAVQREHRDDVLEPGGLHAAQQISHRATVELEHTEGVPAGQQLVGRGVVQRQRLEHQVDTAVGLDVGDRVADDRQVPQPEEVHLQQADGLARRVVPAGDDRAVLRALPQRDRVDQRLGAHDHRAGVHTGVADQALQPASGLVDGAHVGVGVDQAANLGGLLVPLVVGVGDPRQRDVLGHDRRRQRLGDPVGDGEAGLAVVHPGGVLQRGLGLDGAERDDLGHPVAAVLLGGVAHHLTAAAVVEVDVDIGHRRAFGVQEPLEQQTVLDGVDVGDPQRVGHQRAGGRTPARTDPDVHRAGVVDQVGDDEEIGREALVADDLDLIGRAFGVVGGHPVGEPPGQAAVHFETQPAGLGVALGYREDRHPVARRPHVGVGLHPLGDQQRGVARLGNLGVPELAHLGGRLQVVAVAVELEPVRVRQGLAGLHTQQGLVIVGGVAGDVVAVVGGQRPDAELAANLEQPVPDPAFDGQPVVHQLQEVVVRAEDLAPPRGRLERLAIVAEAQPGLHLAGGAAGGGDDALGVLGDDLGVHPRPLAQLTLERGPRREPEQVAQTDGVLGHHRQVGVGTAAGDVVALLARVTPQDAPGVETGSGSHVRLDADDRFDADLGGRVVELAGTEHVSVVGHADGGHLQALGLGEQGGDLRRTVQHRVLGVVVQVHEAIHRPVSLGPPGDTIRRVAPRVR